MQTLARVQGMGAGRIQLACESTGSACAACAGGRGCALRWLARPGGTTLELPEPSWAAAGLRAGDDVVVEVEDGELLHAALRAYLPPLAGLIAGPVAAGYAAPGSEPAALAAALVGLLLGWWLARAWLVRVPPRYRLRPAEPA